MPDFIKAVGAARFGVMAGVAAALTLFFLYIAGVITEPAKSILFSGVEPRDAQQITAKLDTMNVPYDVKGDGGTILVPSDQVTKLRMELASENLPSAGVGYEIFDKSDAFGTTAFVQNINRLRALEGELARSIQTIEGVDSARVHLVIPERQIFSRDAQNPSGSVVLKTRGVMDRGQVGAIQHLVAAAVAGLEPSRIAIIDDKGDLLAGGDSKDGVDTASADEEQHATDFEDRLRQRIESIVASIVGPGHVRAQVSADINFNRISETSEKYDPDSKVVRSTQTVEQNANDSQNNSSNAVSVANALPNAQQQTGGNDSGNKSNSARTEETTNYEISKTVTTSNMNGGDVKRLSVAVVVDGDYAGPNNETYRPRTPKEMQQIEALVKSAMGFSKTRGDQVQISNMAFARMDSVPATPAPTPLLGLESGQWFKIIEVALLSLTALLIGFFVMRPLISKMFGPIALPGQIVAVGQAAAGQLPAPIGEASSGSNTSSVPAKENMIDISRIEGQVRESSIRKVGEVVQAHPEEALAILRTWLHQPG
ncbi:MAG TPA: flagellar basal-body MS-ring/collar protein FliF [Rhizomicrobium sp.]